MSSESGSTSTGRRDDSGNPSSSSSSSIPTETNSSPDTATSTASSSTLSSSPSPSDNNNQLLNAQTSISSLTGAGSSSSITAPTSSPAPSTLSSASPSPPPATGGDTAVSRHAPSLHTISSLADAASSSKQPGAGASSGSNSTPSKADVQVPAAALHNLPHQTYIPLTALVSQYTSPMSGYVTGPASTTPPTYFTHPFLYASSSPYSRNPLFANVNMNAAPGFTMSPAAGYAHPHPHAGITTPPSSGMIGYPHSASSVPSSSASSASAANTSASPAPTMTSTRDRPARQAAVQAIQQIHAVQHGGGYGYNNNVSRSTSNSNLSSATQPYNAAAAIPSMSTLPTSARGTDVSGAATASVEESKDSDNKLSLLKHLAATDVTSNMNDIGVEAIEERVEEDIAVDVDLPHYHHNDQQMGDEKTNGVTLDIYAESASSIIVPEEVMKQEVVRCVCGKIHIEPTATTPASAGTGDENMSVTNDNVADAVVQCEGCLVWQHARCVGLTSLEHIPADYYCELCQPDNPIHTTRKQYEDMLKRISSKSHTNSNIQHDQPAAASSSSSSAAAAAAAAAAASESTSPHKRRQSSLEGDTTSITTPDSVEKRMRSEQHEHDVVATTVSRSDTKPSNHTTATSEAAPTARTAENKGNDVDPAAAS